MALSPFGQKRFLRQGSLALRAGLGRREAAGVGFRPWRPRTVARMPAADRERDKRPRSPPGSKVEWLPSRVPFFPARLPLRDPSKIETLFERR